jgi:hypothetical protein
VAGNARRLVVVGLVVVWTLAACAAPALPAFPHTRTERLVVYEDTLLVRITADGQVRTMIVDTGATITSFTSKAAAAHGIVATGVATINLGRRNITRNPIRVAIGTVEVLDQLLLVHDDPAFAEVGLAGGPAMIVGPDLFHGRALVLATRDLRLYVSP